MLLTPFLKLIKPILQFQTNLLTKSYLDQMLLRPNVTQTKCYLDKMLLRRNVTQTKCYLDQMLIDQLLLDESVLDEMLLSQSWQLLYRLQLISIFSMGTFKFEDKCLIPLFQFSIQGIKLRSDYTLIIKSYVYQTTEIY